MHKASKFEMAQRVKEVGSILIAGGSRRHIIEHCRKSYGVGSKAADVLIAKASEEIKQHFETIKTRELEKHYIRRERLLNIAWEKGDHWLYLKTLDSLARLSGYLSEAPKLNIIDTEIIIGDDEDEAKDKDKKT